MRSVLCYNDIYCYRDMEIDYPYSDTEIMTPTTAPRQRDDDKENDKPNKRQKTSRLLFAKY